MPPIGATRGASRRSATAPALTSAERAGHRALHFTTRYRAYVAQALGQDQVGRGGTQHISIYVVNRTRIVPGPQQGIDSLVDLGAA